MQMVPVTSGGPCGDGCPPGMMRSDPGIGLLSFFRGGSLFRSPCFSDWYDGFLRLLALMTT